MINPFLLHPQERLDNWKTFRKSLHDQPELTQLEAVAAYWANAPILKIAYDPEAPEAWPTIWEMVNAGEWCRNSIAIGMEATLRVSGWHPDRLELLLVNDREISDMMLLVRVDSTWAMNHEWGVLKPYPTGNVATIRRYCWKGQGYAFRN